MILKDHDRCDASGDADETFKNDVGHVDDDADADAPDDAYVDGRRKWCCWSWWRCLFVDDDREDDSEEDVVDVEENDGEDRDDGDDKVKYANHTFEPCIGS